MMDGTYLEVVGWLGTALVDLSGGVMDFKTTDGFGMILGTGLALVLVNVKGLGGGGGGGREPMDSNRSFPAMSTLRIVLEALEIFRHMLDASTYSSTTSVAYIQNLVGVLKDNLKNGNRTYPSYHPDISLLKLMSTHSKTKWRKFLT